jgi:predicted transcriptional regulator
MYYKNKYEGISKVLDKEEIKGNLPDDAFETAINGLIAKGLFEKRIVDGEVQYSITELGIQFGELRYANQKILN